jgi:phosphomevalonate kinase
MQVRAPGKIVLSGAYAVLSGAPAIVTAVDRYVVADPARVTSEPTPEVAAAMGSPAPVFDASALRENGEKLGLGSSAAILVASLGARVIASRGPLPDAELARAVLSDALDAHARAQGGGSGVDVAAAAFGGTLSYRRGTPLPSVDAVVLLPKLVIETWWSGKPAVTAELIARVTALAARDAARHDELLLAQTRAAESAEEAVKSGDGAGFVRALSEQRAALTALGAAAGAEIVTPAVTELGVSADRDLAAVLPAGAGGGDIVLHVGPRPSSPDFRALAARLRHRLLPLSLGARGVHAWPSHAPGASVPSQ